MGKMSCKSVASSAFWEFSPYKQKLSPHSAAPHGLTRVKICTLYHKNMLSSNLLETSCYWNTLAMNPQGDIVYTEISCLDMNGSMAATSCKSAAHVETTRAKKFRVKQTIPSFVKQIRDGFSHGCGRV